VGSLNGLVVGGWWLVVGGDTILDSPIKAITERPHG